jgi:hypothetical protein
MFIGYEAPEERNSLMYVGQARGSLCSSAKERPDEQKGLYPAARPHEIPQFFSLHAKFLSCAAAWSTLFLLHTPPHGPLAALAPPRPCPGRPTRPGPWPVPPWGDHVPNSRFATHCLCLPSSSLPLFIKLVRRWWSNDRDPTHCSSSLCFLWKIDQCALWSIDDAYNSVDCGACSLLERGIIVVVGWEEVVFILLKIWHSCVGLFYFYAHNSTDVLGW